MPEEKREKIKVGSIEEEYAWIAKQYGKRDVDWKFLGQALVAGWDGKKFDRLEIELTNGEKKEIDFDFGDAD